MSGLRVSVEHDRKEREMIIGIIIGFIIGTLAGIVLSALLRAAKGEE